MIYPLDTSNKWNEYLPVRNQQIENKLEDSGFVEQSEQLKQ